MSQTSSSSPRISTKDRSNLREIASYLLKIDFYLHEIAELKNARRASAPPKTKN